MNYFVRPIDEKDNLNNLLDDYFEPKNSYYVAEDKECNIAAGLGVHKIDGNENTCELRDFFIVESFSDSKVIIDLVTICISFSKKYYNSICIRITDDDNVLKKILLDKKFKLIDEKIGNLEVLNNQKLYLLKYKTVGWVREALGEFVGEIFIFIILLGLGIITSLFLPDKCNEQLDVEGLMALGGFIFIVLPCLLVVLIRTILDRKEKKK